MVGSGGKDGGHNIRIEQREDHLHRGGGGGGGTTMRTYSVGSI